MLPRILAALLGTLHTTNGICMIMASRTWYEQVAGVSSTGPFNSHFVTDIGLAFLVAGVGLLLYAWRPVLQLLALGACGFVVMHAVYHFVLLLQGHTQHLAMTLLSVVVPAALGLLLTWPRKEIFHAR